MGRPAVGARRPCFARVDSLVTHAVTCSTFVTRRADSALRPTLRALLPLDDPRAARSAARRSSGTPRGFDQVPGSGRRSTARSASGHVSESQAACRAPAFRRRTDLRDSAPTSWAICSAPPCSRTCPPRRSSGGPRRPPRGRVRARKSIAGVPMRCDFEWHGRCTAAPRASVRRQCQLPAVVEVAESSQISQVASADRTRSASSRSSISRCSALRAWVQDVDVPTIFTPAHAYAATSQGFAALSGGRSHRGRC